MTVRDYLSFVARIKGCRGRARVARQRRDGAHPGRGHGESPLREVVEGVPAAGRPCAGDHAQPGRADPRRATAGLDPKQINETRQLIKDLGGDHTVILSTHILPEVSQTCRVVIINKGRVVAVDTPRT